LVVFHNSFDIFYSIGILLLFSRIEKSKRADQAIWPLLSGLGRPGSIIAKEKSPGPKNGSGLLGKQIFKAALSAPGSGSFILPVVSEQAAWPAIFRLSFHKIPALAAAYCHPLFGGLPAALV
jgi:hypothetical protein